MESHEMKPEKYPMRRAQQSLPEEDVEKILFAHQTGILSLVDEEGMPYGVPLNYTYDKAGGRLLFHCGRVGRKVAAIRHQGYGSFCIIHKDKLNLPIFSNDYASVMVAGPIRLVEDAEEKRKLIEIFMSGYCPADYPGLQKEYDTALNAVVMVELKLENITGKESRALHKARAGK